MVATMCVLAGRSHAEDLALVRPTAKPFTWIMGLSSSTKNLSFGGSGCWADYVRTDLQSDFLISSLLSGFDHDDLDSIRFSSSTTFGVRLATGPFRVERRCGERPRIAKIVPDFVIGGGFYGVSELDSVSQAFRTGHAGVFLGWSVGGFASFVFNDITVTMLFRPFEQTAFYRADDWDATDFRFNNPTLEIELSYVLPI